MGIRIIQNQEGIEFLAFGTLNGFEVMQARKKIYSAKQQSSKYFLFNNSQCTEYNITALDIISIAKLDILASKKNPTLIMATIESEHLIFSLTEAWHAHIEDYLVNLKSFTDRNSAFNWIQTLLDQTCQ